jgi:NAD(P)-dependent dehydrogenase (short-subunit alcohol dehydrogenase family)
MYRCHSNIVNLGWLSDQAKDRNFSMKTILITGSNKGIGFEIARQCAAQGHRVVLSGRDELRLAEAQKKLFDSGLKCATLKMDVSDLLSIESAARTFGKMFPVLDVLVNNAAIIVKNDDSLSGDSDESFTKTINTNGYGPLRVTRSFARYLKDGSQVINISSGGGSMTDPIGGWSPAYCVSKTMLNGITRHLAYELQQQNIRVNAVCPGWVKTDMGGQGASRTVDKGAGTPVWLINDGTQESGLFFRDKKQIPW